MQAIYIENHSEEDTEVCIGQRLGTIHSMNINKEAWLKEELRGGSGREKNADKDETPSDIEYNR